MWRNFWTAASIIGVIVVLLVLVAVNATFLFHHPRTKGVRVEIDKRTGAAVVVTPVSAVPDNGASLPEAGLPRVEVAETDHHFGMMNPHTTAQYKFTIHNAGSAPLKLRVGPTSCVCTVSGLASSVVPPGESTAATLQWTTGPYEHFSQFATIYTNDPNKKSIDFGVEGKVRTIIGADEPEIVLDRLDLDRPTIVERFIYSQIWNDFTVESLQTQIKGLSWEVAAVDPASVPSLCAKSVRRLRLTIPRQLPQGSFREVLRLAVQPDDAQQASRCLDLSLSGSVPRRFAVYGAGIDANGVIDLGNVREGQSKRVRLLVKVRDGEPGIDTQNVVIQPDFLTAELSPHADHEGLYYLTIELPDQVPPCQYRSTRTGHLRIETGHPRIGDVEFNVTFAVVPRQTL